MSIEILALGINGAAAALAAGCVALLRLTVKNFKESRAGVTVADPPASNFPKSVHSVKSRETLQTELDIVFNKPITGNASLLDALGLPKELQPTLLIEGTHLSSTAASIGFSNLELVTRKIMAKFEDHQPYLFGVNRGGGLIANLLSQRLGLDQKHLVRCDYRPDWKRVLCEPRRGVTLAIVIDDAVRTGETLKAIKHELAETYPDARIFVLALVVSIDETSGSEEITKKLFSLVDYYSWISKQRQTSLPWTGKQSDDAADYIEEEGVNQILARLISHDSEGKTEEERTTNKRSG